MQLKLTTKSFVLMGAGEGTAMVDADSVFHPTGFPYIPGRRIKGLLKESLIEVMEMYGQSQDAIADMLSRLFGVEGADRPMGGLVFPNLYLEEWSQLLGAWQKASAEDRKAVFYPENIKRQFSAEIPQTAVEDGVAKDSSLRMYRVLKPELTFVATFHLPENEGEKTWLGRAISNLRRAGTRRNKGFGSIKLSLVEKEDKVSASANSPFLATNRLQVRIKTLSPVLLSQRDGEQNTVFTERHIAGTHVRGLLAEQVIRKKNLGRTAHEDGQFYEWILAGGLSYLDCTLQGAAPLPQHVQVLKNKKADAPKETAKETGKEEPCKEMAFDAFVPSEDKSKPLDGFGRIGDGKVHRVRAHTTFMFHNSRPNRTAGKSMDDDVSQGIFYYEAIAEGQEFIGEIHAASAQALQDLVTLLGRQFTCQMGRSRSAQYGTVEVSLTSVIDVSPPPTPSKSNSYYLVLDTPLILLNEMGVAEADAGLLGKCLQVKGLPNTTIKNAITYHRWVEQYNAVWQSKTTRQQAFAAGSVFELDSAPDDWATLASLQQLGEQAHLGFGRVRLYPKEDFEQPLEVVAMEIANTDSPTSEPKLLKDMRERHGVQQQQVEASNRAIKDAKGRRVDIPNHLASWILTKLGGRRLRKETWHNEWKAWLTDLRERRQQAYKTLDDAQVFESLLALQPLGSQAAPQAEEWGHQYWTTYFETIRKRNKKEKQ